MKMYPKMKIILVAFFVATAIAGCSGNDALAVSDATITVETQRATVGTLALESQYIGTIASENEAQVIAQVSGVVEAVHVKVGDRVKVGTLLCQMDDTTAQYTLESSKAGYESAVAGYGSATAYGSDSSQGISSLTSKVRLAQQNADNMAVLFQTGAISQAQLDSAQDSLLEAQAALKAANAGVDTAEAALQSAQTGVAAANYQTQLYQVTAPIDGVIDTVNVVANNMFAGGNIAFAISDPNSRTVIFYVSDQVWAQLTVGRAVIVNYNEKTYQGAVSEIGTAVDPATGLFKVKALLSNADDLPNGAIAAINMVTHTTDTALLVPYEALYFENNKAFVYIDKEGTAKKCFVTVESYNSETAAVKEGLIEGDAVITSWSSALKDGVAVRSNTSQALEENDVSQ
jgi:RND family efflux transporter MFP subunit